MKELYKNTFERVTTVNQNDNKNMYKFQIFEKSALDQKEKSILSLNLPCKIGDKIYSFCEDFGILEYEVETIMISRDDIKFECFAYSKETGDKPSESLDSIEVSLSDFGETVFLSKENL